jgi:creatinine amidohydrolase
MRLYDRNWMQIRDYLRHDDRVVLPVGSTEQHGYLSLGTDAILAERVSVEAAEPLGIPVLPALPFGMTPYFVSYAGSMSLRMSTYISVMGDLLDCLYLQGFRRIAVINGHGGNSPVTGLIREWQAQPREDAVEVIFHNWWNAPRTAATAAEFDPVQMHGAWVESFPWTRVSDAEVPQDPIPALSRDLVGRLSRTEMLEVAPDGSHGGSYQRSDAEMDAVWQAGVDEVRDVLENGWLK